MSDLVRGIYELLQSDINSPVNIGNPHEMTLKELAETVCRLSRSKSRLVYRPLPQDDPRVRQPDIRIARKRLHWEPKVPFEAGLQKTIAYFRQAARRP